jgi:DNA-binding Lrp family transcriptional regulator
MALNRKERDWLQWLHQAKRKQITQREAAQRMQVSERWVRQLLRRMKRQKDRVVVHGLRGRPSNRRMAKETQTKAVAIVRAEYGDFGPTLAAEYLEEKHQIQVSRETLRQWMMTAGIWRARRAGCEQVHLWRPRRSSFGELVQWDTSDHDWLEGRGPQLVLIAMTDDASSRAQARFALHDSTAENMRLLRQHLQKWGRPLAFYTDKARLFTNAPGWNVELKGEPPKTQIGRALQELDIEWIPAHSPQAKGRQERFFGTAQDRLVKGLRKAGVNSLAGANQYLQQVYLPMWEQRFTCEPASSHDAHRPLLASHNLEAILSHQEMRCVSNDYTLRFAGQRWQIERDQVCPGLRNGQVLVERRLDGNLRVRFRDRYLTVHACPLPVKAPPPPPRRRGPRAPHRSHGSGWMQGFDLSSAPSLQSILRKEGR